MKYALSGGLVNMLAVIHLGTEVRELGGPVPHSAQQWNVLNLKAMVHATSVHVPRMTVECQKAF